MQYPTQLWFKNSSLMSSHSTLQSSNLETSKKRKRTLSEHDSVHDAIDVDLIDHEDFKLNQGDRCAVRGCTKEKGIRNYSSLKNKHLFPLKKGLSSENAKICTICYNHSLRSARRKQLEEHSSGADSQTTTPDSPRRKRLRLDSLNIQQVYESNSTSTYDQHLEYVYTPLNSRSQDDSGEDTKGQLCNTKKEYLRKHVYPVVSNQDFNDQDFKQYSSYNNHQSLKFSVCFNSTNDTWFVYNPRIAIFLLETHYKFSSKQFILCLENVESRFCIWRDFSSPLELYTLSKIISFENKNDEFMENLTQKQLFNCTENLEENISREELIFHWQDFETRLHRFKVSRVKLFWLHE